MLGKSLKGATGGSGPVKQTGTNQTERDDPSLMGGSGLEGQTQVDQRDLVTFVDAPMDDVQPDPPIPKMDMIILGDTYSEMSKWLKRPAHIATITWQAFGTEVALDIFNLYRTKLNVAKAISFNYALYTGGLKLTIKTNGSPYQFGAKALAIFPLPVGDPMYTTDNLASSAFVTSLPGLRLVDPSADSIMELTVPELLVQEQIVSAASYVQAYLISLELAVLATTFVSPPTQYCEINIYAECVDPKLHFPTSVIATGASGEAKGAISGPLSIASTFSKQFSQVPIIGKFATSFSEATDLGAKVAALFGFSKPDTDQGKQMVALRAGTNFANFAGNDYSESLSGLPQTSTIIDPACIGLPPIDEMAYKNILSKLSLLRTFSWNTSNPAGTQLDTWGHSPINCMNLTPSIFPTWLAAMSFAHTYWRGSIVYRIRFCVSKFHTGRVQIIYEPNSALGTGDVTSTTMNYIVDLADTTDFEFTVPFVFNQPIAPIWAGATDMIGANGFPVGNIFINNLTLLRAGGVSSTINALVFVRAGEDFQLMCPTTMHMRNSINCISYFPAHTITASPQTTYHWLAASSEPVDAKTPLHPEPVGAGPFFSMYTTSDVVTSLRQLLSRSMGNFQINRTVGSSASLGIFYQFLPDLGVQPGQIPPLWYFTTNNHTFMTYFLPWFAAYRGGVRHKLLCSASYSVLGTNAWHGNITAFKALENDGTIFTWAGTSAKTNNWMSMMGMGAASQPILTNQSFEVKSHYVNPNYCQPIGPWLNNNQQQSGIVVGVRFAQNATDTADSNIALDWYTSAADDFTLYYLKAPPTMYVLSIS